MKARFAAALALAAATATATAQSPDREAGEWNFAATLDDKPIGTHRFVVSGQADGRSVESQAHFVVRMLGIPVYEYAHQARERWDGDCLRELDADTDENRRRETVQRHYGAECLMGYAYWNPRLALQRQLVNPQTGRVGAVRFERVPDAVIDVRGRPVPAQGWRLLADKQCITVWYAADSGRWIALDAEAKGGRRLSYRLPPEKARP